MFQMVQVSAVASGMALEQDMALLKEYPASGA